jgi:hypothetical protein
MKTRAIHCWVQIKLILLTVNKEQKVNAKWGEPFVVLFLLVISNRIRDYRISIFINIFITE